MRRRGFTLVELLVVIGIIAVLIGILLPTLSAARKQADAVKCAASLRDIGNAVQMYCGENRQYMPPLRTYPLGSSYNVDGITYDTTKSQTPYWYTFLAKYVTKNKVGFGVTNINDYVQAQKSIFYACPSYTPYDGDIASLISSGRAVQTGYGWNAFPEYTPSFPDPSTNSEIGETTNPDPTIQRMIAIPASGDLWKTIKVSNSPGPSGPYGKWYKQKAYSLSSDRALLADAQYYVLEARPPLTTAPYYVAQSINQYNLLWAGTNGTHQTTFDVYRHGRYPGVSQTDTTTFTLTGGKINYNILFCDGHVAAQTGFDQAYKSVRMKFPG